MNNCSFRDRDGYMFYSNGILLRHVNKSYFLQYEQLMKGGLYDKAVKQNVLISHSEIKTRGDYCILQPEIIPFISYPYEWCFSQLKEAAILTLNLQLLAMEYDMTLKDASSYNVQFLNGHPIWIDTLSFEKYNVGKPWTAYKQFCQHFLSPLALMSYCDYRLIHLMKSNIDGIPLDLTSKILPKYSWLNTGILFHVHMHSRIGAFGGISKTPHMSKSQLVGLIDNLITTIKKLNFKMRSHDWVNYYNDNSYKEGSINSKASIVSNYLSSIPVGKLWDIGGNTGYYTRIASEMGFNCILLDNDFECIEKAKQNNLKSILPLYVDINNPSSGIGWRNGERGSLFDRGHPDTVMALALIHHMVIGNNLTFEMVSDFFGNLCNNLIIEFVPRTDDRAKKLLSHREDIFSDYTRENFEMAFLKNFVIKRINKIEDSERILYQMEKK